MVKRKAKKNFVEKIISEKFSLGVVMSQMSTTSEKHCWRYQPEVFLESIPDDEHNVVHALQLLTPLPPRYLI